jgi:hypothetical protein
LALIAAIALVLAVITYAWNRQNPRRAAAARNAFTIALLGGAIVLFAYFGWK